ncbi:MAG TPA: hydroxymethylbilane synthase [Rugosimonospora sp.]|nr:hydroxymethylbilane synthase [Rugosimonospora sp.]
MSALRLGTRGSALALAQSGLIADRVRRRTGHDVELVEIVTPGDRSSAPVARLGVGVFVSALRDALGAKEVDFAVHSYKDLPTAPAEELVIAAVPEREDPRDALVARDGLTLSQLAPGARVGTGALRRIAQLHALGRQLEVVPIRGNVDTRLRKLTGGELDAVVLARAGLARLGRADEVTEILDPELMLPAPAQGALAVECRADAPDLVEALSTLDDPDTRAAVTAERALLARLEAGCSAPVAALATVIRAPVARGGRRAPGAPASTESAEIHLRGAVLSTDGRVAIRLSRTGTLTDAATIGRDLAEDLLGAGAETVLGVHE